MGMEGRKSETENDTKVIHGWDRGRVRKTGRKEEMGTKEK